MIFDVMSLSSDRIQPTVYQLNYNLTAFSGKGNV